MATPGRTAADYRAELAAKIDGALDKQYQASLGNVLRQIMVGKFDLREARAKRGTDVTKVAGAYATAANSNIKGALARATVDILKMQRTLPIDFAKAAYAPDLNVINTVESNIPVNVRDDAKQRSISAWKAFFKVAKASDGNIQGTWDRMVRDYGKFDPAYITGDQAAQNAYTSFRQVEKTAEANAAQFAQQASTFKQVDTAWSRFVAENPQLDPTSDEAYTAFANAHEDLLAKLPKPGSAFVTSLEKIAADPEKHPEFFSDIDKMLADTQTEEEKYLALMRAEKDETTTARARTDREKLAGWIQRPDVQAWAKEWGLNLGTVREITPEIQKLIDDGQISKDDLVNGRLYTSSPDDMRAIRLAYRQMHRNPQKNIFYKLGLTKQAGPKQVVEVEEIVKPAGARPKGVEARTIVGADGKNARIVKLDDGSYAIGPAQKGATYTKLSAVDGAKMFDAAPAGQTFTEPVELKGIEGDPAQTRTRRFQVLGREYGVDETGTVRGIDLDTGKLDKVTPDKIASKTVTHGGTEKTTIGDALLRRRATATAKQYGIDITTEAQNAMDIGREATKGQIRESAQTTAEIAKGLPPVPASYVGEGLVGRMRGPLTEAEIARQDARTAAGAAGVSPFEQVKPGDYKEQKISSSPEEQAAQKAAEGAMFDKALSEAAAPKPRLPVVSPAPGVVTAGMPASAPKQGPAGSVLDANVRDTGLNQAVRDELSQRPGGNVTPASAAQYGAARAAAVKKGATTEPIAEPEEAPKPPTFGEEIAAAVREEREVPALPEPPDMKKKYAEVARQAYAAAAARANAPQTQGQRSGRPPPVSPPLP